jgi:hypothetical protein
MTPVPNSTDQRNYEQPESATEAPPPPLIEATTGKFSEEQALHWRAANPNSTKTVREIAELWGWSKSATQRFVSRCGTKPGTRPETRPETRETDALSRETDEADFHWSDDQAVVVQHQPALAVYLNPLDQIVLRAHGGYDDDSIIIVSAENVPKVIAKLTALLKELTA